MTTSTSPHADWSALAQVQQETAGRLRVLTAKEQGALLDDAEALEVLALQRRLASLAPRLEALAAQVRRQQQAVDVEQVTTAWATLREKKVQAHERFYASITALREAFAGIAAVHGEQEALLATLPRDLRTRMAFVDRGSLLANVCSRLPEGAAWRQLLLAQGEAARPIDPAQVKDVDPGCHALPGFLQHYRPQEN